MRELYKGNSCRWPWLIQPEILLQCSSVKGGYSLGAQCLSFGMWGRLIIWRGKIRTPHPQIRACLPALRQLFCSLANIWRNKWQIPSEAAKWARMGVRGGNQLIRQICKIGTTHSFQGFRVGRVFFLFTHLSVIYSVVLTVAGCSGKTK